MNFFNIWHNGLIRASMTGQESGVPLWLFGCLALAIALMAYFLGSINSAVLISNRIYHDDVRKHGSKNAGMTNMLRTFGKKAAGLTLLFDFLKAFVSAVIAALLLGDDGIAISMVFCMIGHMFPVYFHFRGGKGVLVAATSLLVLEPITFLITICIFLLVVLGTKYVSLGSVMSALLFPMIYNRIYSAFIVGIVAKGAIPDVIVTSCTILACLLVVIMHGSNIRRLLNGEESKISLGKKK